MREFSIVVAMDQRLGIGKKGTLPWPHLWGDMRFYKELTSCPDRSAVESRYGLTTNDTKLFAIEEYRAFLRSLPKLPQCKPDCPNAVIIGRKTWESIPRKFRPLPGRRNCVLTRFHHDPQEPDAAPPIWCTSLDEAMIDAEAHSAPEIFVVGGGELYASAIASPRCERLYITMIDRDFNCDTRFPAIGDRFVRTAMGHRVVEHDMLYQFTLWTSRR